MQVRNARYDRPYDTAVLSVSAGSISADGVEQMSPARGLAQVATTGVVMIWNFAANRFWTFAEPL